MVVLKLVLSLYGLCDDSDHSLTKQNDPYLYRLVSAQTFTSGLV